MARPVPLFETESQKPNDVPVLAGETTAAHSGVQGSAPGSDAHDAGHAPGLLVENAAVPTNVSNALDSTGESAGPPWIAAMPPAVANPPGTGVSEQPGNNHNAAIVPNVAHQLVGLHWTSVSGVLAQQSTRPEELDYPDRVVWNGTAAGSESFSNEDTVVHLRTLPACRAEAEIFSGGAIVLAADTGVQIRRGRTSLSAENDIEHGAFALKDLPQDTVIRLQSAGRSAIELGWRSSASVIIGFSPEGLQAWVLEGAIAINEQPVEAAALLITELGNTTLVDAPRRLPEWLERESDPSQIPKHILAQLARSSNLETDLNRGIVELVQSSNGSATDNRSLALMANWQSALSDTQLYRLAGSRIPVIRQAA